ncbi:MAG: molybdopterin molybdotransferase MoeA [Oscillospiraceae bacterium]|jgi:molybdopterin molybdotransferase|nr:molybdopterin molybdotransferase MoeA [Oscillospiraceae bacterium]
MRNLSVEQSAEILVQHASKPKRSEKAALLDAAGRVAARDIFARINQPPFNRSPLDGYAVLHDDIRNSSRDSPAVLRVTERIFAGAGAFPAGALNAGEAALVTTGSPLPPGATCVVRQEDTDGGEETVRVFSPVGEYENYCWEGEDVREGTLIARGGQRLNCAHIAVLAGQGYTDAEVCERPRIGILSTGSELVPAGQLLAPGKIYDSNGYYLALRVRQLGAQSFLSGSADDDPEKLAAAIHGLLRACDMVITTGGVASGARDCVPAAGKALGAQELFRGVDMKPGAPAMALYKEDRLILCLSGNPFAAAASFEVLGGPAVKKLAGDCAVFPKRIKGILANSFSKKLFGKKNHIRRFVRGRAEGGEIYLLPGGDSPGIIASMTECNCLADTPAHSFSLNAGDPVDAVLLEDFT